MKRIINVFFIWLLTTSVIQAKPNIIYIMADDLGIGDPGCYGGKTIATPNIDRLAKEGLRFNRAYSGGPVCTSSRCVLMTGLHNGHTVARDNVPHYQTYLQDEDITVAEVLKTVGYRCGGIGKWSLGDAGTVGRATNQGFDSWFGYLNQDHAHYYYPEYLDDDEGQFDLTGNTQTRKHYTHPLLTERALKFIRESKDQPFFFYAAYALPHFSAKDEDPDGLTVPSTDPYTDKLWDERSKKYASMVHRLDRDIGRIIDLVDELGLAKNTLIIVTSDNGGHKTIHERFDTNGPFRGYKRDLTEGGIRVPFIARWPGKIPANQTSEEVVAFQDMLPTFAELAGAKSPDQLDGISVVTALKGESLHEPRPPLYWDYGHCRGRQYAQAALIGSWKGLRKVKDGNQLELYNIDKDPGETTDLAESNPEKVKEIEAFFETAVVPHPKYQLGTIYKGSAIWKKSEDSKTKPLAISPVPHPGKEKLFLSFNEISKQGKAQLVFLGDSITQGWGGRGKEAWEKYWEPLGAANFGIGGDRTEHVLWRLQNGNYDGLNAKLTVLMIGTNNTGHEGRAMKEHGGVVYSSSARQTAEGIDKIVKLLRKKQPQMKILLLGIFPRGADNQDPKRQKNDAINQMIAKLADRKMVHYLNINKAFLEKDGTLSRDIMPDLLHLNAASYETWAQSIEEKVRELMKD